MRRALVMAVLVQAATARADSSVTVTLNPQGAQLASDLGFSVADMIATTRLKIDELYKVSRLPGLLRGFADTAAIAQRGLGVDYDPDSGDILIGATAGGIHGDVAIGTTNDLLGGSIVNFAVMTGVNLGRWNHPRWTAFASGFYESTTIHDLEGTLLTLGAHVQYRLVPPASPARARWMGVLACSSGIYRHGDQHRHIGVQRLDIMSGRTIVQRHTGTARRLDPCTLIPATSLSAERSVWHDSCFPPGA